MKRKAEVNKHTITSRKCVQLFFTMTYTPKFLSYICHKFRFHHCGNIQLNLQTFMLPRFKKRLLSEPVTLNKLDHSLAAITADHLSRSQKGNYSQLLIATGS